MIDLSYTRSSACSYASHSVASVPKITMSWDGWRKSRTVLWKHFLCSPSCSYAAQEMSRCCPKVFSVALELSLYCPELVPKLSKFWVTEYCRGLSVGFMLNTCDYRVWSVVHTGFKLFQLSQFSLTCPRVVPKLSWIWIYDLNYQGLNVVWGPSMSYEYLGLKRLVCW